MKDVNDLMQAILEMDAAQRKASEKAKAERTAFFAQLLRIALILVAETEIVPRDEVYGAVLLHQQLGDEVLPRHGHHRAVKRLDEHCADAVILTDDLRALRRACEQRHGNAGDKLLR